MPLFEKSGAKTFMARLASSPQEEFMATVTVAQGETAQTPSYSVLIY